MSSDLNGDPGLGEFVDDGTAGNGHYPLLPTSQAIDAADDEACLETDQIGNSRPIDGDDDGTPACNIGAIEFQGDLTPAETLAFNPVADATIKEDFPDENFGAIREVETDNRPVQHFLMKFDISGIGDRQVMSAKLRLHCMDKSDKGGNFHETDNDWSEDTVTWENAPEPDPEPVASLGPVVRRTWVEVDLSPVITHDGTYSFRVISPSRDGADYRSKEKRRREPELVITVK